MFVFAGPNGSGKSTIIREFQKLSDFPAQYINPDVITQQLPGDASTYLARSRQAQQIVEQQRQDFIANRTSFAFETVASHPSKVALMHQANQAGFEVTLVFVCTNDPAINVDRVALRVRNGGHDVQTDKIISRYHRTLRLLPSAVDVANRAIIFDNTESYSQGAIFENGELVERNSTLTDWLNQIIAQVSERQQERQQIAVAAEQKKLTLQPANILSGDYTGDITVVANHYALQRISDSRRVLHDRTLVQAECGISSRITYAQGVSVTQPQQTRDRGLER